MITKPSDNNDDDGRQRKKNKKNILRYISMTTKPSNTNMVQTTSVALMMLDFTMIELTIPTRMPRFYEEEQEENKEEKEEGEGVRHWRLFLVVIVCS